MTIQQIKTWSFSRWTTYRDCAFRAKCKFILRLPEPPSPSMERGNLIHKMAEDFTRGKIKKLPLELSKFSKEFQTLRRVKAVVEEQWAFTENWELCDWFSPAAWLRIKMDVHYVVKKLLRIRDHKTGKPKESHLEQLSLYGLGGLLRYPKVEDVEAALLYLDVGGTPPTEVFSRSQLATLKKEWRQKVQPMLNDKRFLPKPSFACSWCPFSKAKGGPCKY